VVDAPSLETFQARLDGALSNLIQLKMSLLTAGVLGWMAFKAPFQTKLFCDSVIIGGFRSATSLQGPLDLRAALQYLKGPARELEGGFIQGPGVTGQGVMALN